MKKNEKDTEEKKLSRSEDSTAEEESSEKDTAEEETSGKDDTEEEVSEKDDAEEEASDKDDAEEASDKKAAKKKASAKEDDEEEDGMELPPIKRPERKPLSEEELKSNKRILTIEVCVAVVALIIIIVAIALKGKKDDGSTEPDDSAVSASENGSVSADAAAHELVEIDNSALFVGMPPIPEQDTDELPDYDKLMAEKHILKLSTEDGGTVYVHDYTNGAYFKEQCALDEEDVENEIRKNYLVNYLEESDKKNTVAELYDSVKIDYVGKMNGEAFDGGTDQDSELIIGVSPFIDGFTEGIIGMKEGETKDVHVVFPENYGTADLAGKPAVFTITLKEIQHANVVPELTDELASKITEGDFTTAADLRKYVRDMMLSEKIWDFIDTDFYVEKIPEDEVKESYDMMMTQYDQTSQMYQVSVEEMLLGAYGITLDEFKTEIMNSAANSIRHNTLYRTIAASEGITVEKADMQKLADDMAYTGTLEEFIEQYGESNVRNHLIQSKLMDRLIELWENADNVSDNDAVSENAVSDNAAAEE